MKTKTLMAALMGLIFTAVCHGQVIGGPGCPTLEQQQAAYNQQKACSIAVKDTASQQLQTYYQQLATYYQQLDKTNQQIAKDKQQVEKDAQQVAKDLQQSIMDKQLTEQIKALNGQGGYDEVDAFVLCITPLIGECSSELRKECQRIHNVRCGIPDNSGGNHRVAGFDNRKCTVGH